MIDKYNNKKVQFHVGRNLILKRAVNDRCKELGYASLSEASVISSSEYFIISKQYKEVKHSQIKHDNYINGSLEDLFNTDKYSLFKHPEIKIGCQTVQFREDGSAIIVDGHTISRATVREIDRYMQKLQDDIPF